MRWLKPHEMIFFDLLEKSVANVYEAIQYFDREIRQGDPDRWAEVRREMKRFEHMGDEITHRTLDKLNQTFVTPIEREDILHLTHALDDVLDHVDAICERLLLYKIQVVKPALLEVSSIAVEGCGELVFLIKSLRNMADPHQIRLHIRRVHTLENKADSIYHAALAGIFEEIKDAIELIKWKELMDTMEELTDSIELVAKVVGSTVMRNA